MRVWELKRAPLVGKMSMVGNGERNANNVWECFQNGQSKFKEIHSRLSLVIVSLDTSRTNGIDFLWTHD